MLLSATAYILMDTLRKDGLANTESANAQVGTIRLKLLKVGARVVHSVRKIVIHLAGGSLVARSPSLGSRGTGHGTPGWCVLG